MLNATNASIFVKIITMHGRKLTESTKCRYLFTIALLTLYLIKCDAKYYLDLRNKIEIKIFTSKISLLDLDVA